MERGGLRGDEGTWKKWHLAINDTTTRENSVAVKWLFIIKCKVDGTIDRYKARLDANGYNHQVLRSFIEEKKCVNSGHLYMA